ncbi:MAG: hypothetical protein QY318_02535 [Candidatus Dojkabacteria bacterium]|nr:MAG: hypothetical protein QY318_02535 [Candidatus Dojkabacteria bacterium]
MLNGKIKKFSKKIEATGLGACWYGICTPIGDNISTYAGFIDTVQALLNGLIGISGLVAVAVMIFGGITIITSGGDSDKFDKGQKTVTYAVIGLVIVFISVLIVNFVFDVVL